RDTLPALHGALPISSGAKSVTCVDSSEAALDMARRNAGLNKVAVDTVHKDAFQALADFREAGEKFDVVIIDPPAFIKRRKDYKRSEEHTSELQSREN